MSRLIRNNSQERLLENNPVDSIFYIDALPVKYSFGIILNKALVALVKFCSDPKEHVYHTNYICTTFRIISNVMPNKTTRLFRLQYSLQQSISDLSQCYVFIHVFGLYSSELPGHGLARVFFSEFAHERGSLNMHTYFSLICKFLELIAISTVNFHLWVFLDLTSRKFHLVLPTQKPSHQNCPLLGCWEGLEITQSNIWHYILAAEVMAFEIVSFC